MGGRAATLFLLGLFLGLDRVDRPSSAQPFEPNRGQVGGAVAGASSGPLIGAEPLPGRVHYLKRSDPGRWLRDVSTFGAIRRDSHSIV